MKVLASTLALSGLLVAGCGEDEPTESADAFCAEFRSIGALDVGISQEEIAENASFFASLEDDAPEEISDQVSTVADGLEAMAEALAEGEAEGIDAVEAVQELSDVNLDELATAADEIEQYAVENCDDVESPE